VLKFQTLEHFQKLFPDTNFNIKILDGNPMLESCSNPQKT